MIQKKYMTLQTMIFLFQKVIRQVPFKKCFQLEKLQIKKNLISPEMASCKRPLQSLILPFQVEIKFQ